MGRQMDSD